jgi:hypothetical protein
VINHCDLDMTWKACNEVTWFQPCLKDYQKVQACIVSACKASKTPTAFEDYECQMRPEGELNKILITHVKLITVLLNNDIWEIVIWIHGCHSWVSGIVPTTAWSMGSPAVGRDTSPRGQAYPAELVVTPSACGQVLEFRVFFSLLVLSRSERTARLTSKMIAAFISLKRYTAAQAGTDFGGSSN